MLKPLAPLALLLALAACGKPETIQAGGPADPTKNELASAPPVKLPPAMLASVTYRCKDNSVVYVDWFNDSVTAAIKTDKAGSPTPLAAPAAGQPYTGGGYELTGTAEAKTVTIKKPGGAAQACNV